jgi:hypothetical protein
MPPERTSPHPEPARRKGPLRQTLGSLNEKLRCENEKLQGPPCSPTFAVTSSIIAASFQINLPRLAPPLPVLKLRRQRLQALQRRSIVPSADLLAMDSTYRRKWVWHMIGPSIRQFRCVVNISLGLNCVDRPLSIWFEHSYTTLVLIIRCTGRCNQRKAKFEFVKL